MDDQHLGQTPEVKLLGGLLVFLTIWTIPGVIGPELLLTRVQLQALTQIDGLQNGFLRICQLIKNISYLLLWRRLAMPGIVLVKVLSLFLFKEL